jgi:peptidoglycan/LPS O-acetylase OafA/YrhL
MNTLKSNQPEIKALHFTRFAAAFCVVAYHYGKSAFPFQHGLLNTLIQNGGMAVSYFFALSGFIMAYVYGSEQQTLQSNTYWSARFARIYPVYLLSFLLVLITMYVFKGSKPKGISIILQALCIQAWKPGISMEINYVAWSISVELLFYFLFPFVIAYWRKKSLNSILLQASLFWLFSLGMHMWLVNNVSSPDRFNVGQFIAFFPPRHLNSFLLGTAAGIVYHRKLMLDVYPQKYSESLIVLGLLLIYICFILQPLGLGYLTNGGIIPVFLLLILGISLHKGFLQKVFSSRPLIWLGEISYGFYLWQFFIYLFFEKYLPVSSSGMNTSQFYLYILVLLAFSAMSYHLFEIPLRKYIKTKLSLQKL